MKKTKAITKRNMGAALVKEVKKVEDIGTAMMQTSQEFTLCVEEVLKKKFGFTPDQLKLFEQELRYILAITREVEQSGLSVLGPHDMAEVGKIAAMREVRLKIDKARRLPFRSVKSFTEKLKKDMVLPSPKSVN